MKAAIDDLNNVEIEMGLDPIDLTDLEKRILRLFARQRGGASVTVSPLSGGLSGARVLKRVVKDIAHGTRIVAACRIGDLKDIRRETTNCYHEIQRLQGGTYAPLVNEICAGAADKGGAFYFLEDYESNFFGVLKDRVGDAPTVIGRVRAIEHPWLQNVGGQIKTFKQIRERITGSLDVADVLGAARIEGGDAMEMRDALLSKDWKAIDRRRVNHRWVSQHGDLHGLNLLVRRNLNPVIIDYMEVGEGPACLDAITLELSIVFHPEAVKLRGDWPTVVQSLRWKVPAEFAEGSQFEDTVKCCRRWASEAAQSDRAIYATGFALALKQLKYPDTDKRLAVAIATSAIEAFEKSYE